MDRHVLVTGGAGYIGSHAAKAVAQEGFVPVVLDNLARGSRDAVRWGPLVVADLADRAALAGVLARYRPVAVMHFAALAYVGESVRDPAAYYRTNVVDTLGLLDAMRDRGIHALVFSSSCASYGLPVRLPIEESHPQHPINPYGHTKLVIERALRAYDTAYGLRSVALRYFNAAGADPEGDLGENHDPETHLVPLAIRVALGLEPRLGVNGEDYPTTDGTAVRDYVHVTDIARAHVAALHDLLDGGPTRAFNLGTGRGRSVREVVAAVERATGRHVATEPRPRRPGDPPELVADATRARRTLGWQPRYPHLEDMVATAWRWIARQRDRQATRTADRVDPSGSSRDDATRAGPEPPRAPSG